MLRLHNSLMFPSLVRKGEAKFKSHSDSEKTTTVYTLDWSYMDEARAKKWVKWRERWNDIRTVDEFHGSLPPKYDEWVKSLQFALPMSYLEQIRKNTRDAVVGWGTEYHFDTMIRETCLKPAIANTLVAFKLLSDCVYDPETSYFSRNDNRIYATQAMLYKFWVGQTGRGLIKDHADFGRLDHLLKPHPYAKEETTLIVRKFVETIDAFEKDYEKFYELTTKDDATGPFIQISTAGTSTSSLYVIPSEVTIEGDVVIEGSLKVKNPQKNAPS